MCALYLYLDLKKCSPPLSDLQPVLLWTCCPWKRDVNAPSAAPFSFVVLFVCLFFLYPLENITKAHYNSQSVLHPPQPPRGCARGYRAASSVCTIKIPFFSSEHAVPIRFTSTGEMSARSSRRRRRRRRGRNIWGDSPTKRLNKASVLRSSRVCPLWLLQAA